MIATSYLKSILLSSPALSQWLHSISMTTLNHVSPDNVTTSWRTLCKHTCFQNCTCGYLNLWFILHTWNMRCKYQAWSFLSPFYTLHILHSYLGHSHIHIYKYVLLCHQVWHKHYFIFISWHFHTIFRIWPLANYSAYSGGGVIFCSFARHIWYRTFQFKMASLIYYW
jgi:hypothetical protein